MMGAKGLAGPPLDWYRPMRLSVPDPPHHGRPHTVAGSAGARAATVCSGMSPPGSGRVPQRS